MSLQHEWEKGGNYIGSKHGCIARHQNTAQHMTGLSAEAMKYMVAKLYHYFN